VVSRDLLAAVLAVTAGAACAHHAAVPADSYVASSGAAIRTWLGGLPRCPPAKPSDEEHAFRRDEFTDAIAVRGRLMLSSTPACTRNVCTVDCCNTCSPRWVVVTDAGDAPFRELAIQKTGANQPLTAVIRECKLEPVRQDLSSPRVSVSGFLESDVIIRASICVIEEPAAPPNEMKTR